MFYLISYDIQDDRARTRAMKYLKDHGYHLQKSVFVLDCSNRTQAREVYDQIKQFLDLTTDRIFMTPLCNSCWARAWKEGTPVVLERDILIF